MKYFCLALPLTLPTLAVADAPNVQTPSPVLYLADNLDEPESLGYCLDTLGRGPSDRAQLHSCKPQGGDVQFEFDESTGRIASATFDNICLDIANDQFALVNCNDASSQKFDFSASTGEIRPLSNSELCLASVPESRQAGPFMGRDLVLASCETTPVELKSWVQK